MKLHHLPLIGLALGVFLIGLSLVWPSLTRGTLRGEEEAHQHAENAAQVHALLHEREPALGGGHGDPQSHTPAAAGDGENGSAAYQAAKEKHDQSRARLERAQFVNSGVAVWFRWVGIVLTLAGLVGYHFYSRFALGG